MAEPQENSVTIDLYNTASYVKVMGGGTCLSYHHNTTAVATLQLLLVTLGDMLDNISPLHR